MYQGKNYKIYNEDCLIELENMEENSIDSIVTDPPYELNFMNKGWDNAGVSFQKETWEKCLKVLKPGGHLLAFGGSRTFHRIACAIEDAGFEIRDTIMWLYGAGFPKSMNVGKQLEKRLEDEKTKQKTEHDLRLMWERDIQKTMRNEEKQNEILQSQLQEQSLQGTMYGKESKEGNLWREKSSMERWNNIQKTERELQRCKICEMSKRIYINGEERWICNGTQACDGTTLREMLEQSGSCSSYRPQSKQQQDRKSNVIQEQCRTQESRKVIEYWNKFGTALKPSFEPIIVARKPFKGSLVDNIVKWGVGGINIDECRIGNGKRTIPIHPQDKKEDNTMFNLHPTIQHERIETNQGRFPANTILTYDQITFDEVCGGFPYTLGGKRHNIAIRLNDSTSYGGKSGNINMRNEFDDKGSASRYFYCAKASKKDRDEGLTEFEEKQVRVLNETNPDLEKKDDVSSRFITVKRNIHPTVKPTELMQYLIRLVSPKDATILDPFMGSGSTGKAVMYENKERQANYTFIGIEKEKEYCDIAEARIKYVNNKD